VRQEEWARGREIGGERGRADGGRYGEWYDRGRQGIVRETGGRENRATERDGREVDTWNGRKGETGGRERAAKCEEREWTLRGEGEWRRDRDWGVRDREAEWERGMRERGKTWRGRVRERWGER